MRVEIKGVRKTIIADEDKWIHCISLKGCCKKIIVHKSASMVHFEEVSNERKEELEAQWAAELPESPYEMP